MADGRWVVARGVDVAAVLGHPAAVIGPAVASDGGLAAARLRLVDPGITYERRASLRIPASLVLR